MSEPFLAEIRMFGFNFAPSGWALCNGQIMAISQNTALFSLLGTTYGGDGKTTFGLPNLQGSVPMNWGQGPGLTDRVLGEMSGSEAVTLIGTEIPVHNHGFNVTTGIGNVNASSNNQLAKPQTGNPASGFTQGRYFSTGTTNDVLNPARALLPNGQNVPHNNMMPYLVINFCIALRGVFPPRG
jgi:microcystin-dependent protein